MEEDIRPFKFSERNKVRIKWQTYFPDIMFGDVADNLLSVLLKEVKIDMVKLGERLESLYPEEWETQSIEEIVTKHYGENASKLINRLL